MIKRGHRGHRGPSTPVHAVHGRAAPGPSTVDVDGGGDGGSVHVHTRGSAAWVRADEGGGLLPVTFGLRAPRGSDE